MIESMRLWLAILFASCLTTLAGVIPADRLPVVGSWTTLAGVPGGIPTSGYSNTLNVVTGYGAAGDGVTDDTAEIQAALDAATAGSIVYLPAGTYLVTTQLSLIAGVDKSGVIIRGAGSTATRIKSSASGAVLLMSSKYGIAYWSALTANGTRGDYSITVADASSYYVGNYMLVGEETIDTNIVRNNPAYMTEPVAQWLKITNISGGTISFATPLNYTYRTAYGARIAQYSSAFSMPVFNSGIEDLTVERTAAGGDNIQLSGTFECWVSGVESTNARKWHLRIEEGANNEVRRCYLHDTSDGGGDSGYGVGIFRRGGNNLVEDNIFRHCRHSMVTEWGGQGNVFGYNYSLGAINENGVTTDFLMGTMLQHGGTPMFNLWEGNVAERLSWDDVLGGSAHLTAFRNWVTRQGGWYDTNITANLNAVCLQSDNWSNSIVGNVLLTPGQVPTQYDWDEGGTSAITRLGYPDDSGAAWEDGTVTNTLTYVRNYDFWTETSNRLWGTDTGDALPDSYYHASKPSFFYSTNAWPAFGPDVSGKTNWIPAITRYLGGDYTGSSGGDLTVATPGLSPAAGSYETSVEITLSCATGGAAIYYTVDGSAPDAGDTLYSAPFTRTSTTTVKAIGILAEYTDSAVASATYTITAPAPAASGSATVTTLTVNTIQ
jgi:hypothetical protein